MRATIKLSDKKVVYDDVDSLFIPFDNEPILIHKNGDTFPITDKTNISYIKVEDTKLKKEEKNGDTSESTEAISTTL